MIQAQKFDSGCHAILLVFVSQKFGDPACINFRETQFIVKNFTNGGVWDRSEILLCQIALDLTCRSPSVFFNKTTHRVHGVFCNLARPTQSQFVTDVSTAFQKLATLSTDHLNWHYVAIHFNNAPMDSTRVFSFRRVIAENCTHFKLGGNGKWWIHFAHTYSLSHIRVSPRNKSDTFLSTYRFPSMSLQHAVLPTAWETKYRNLLFTDPRIWIKNITWNILQLNTK